MAAVLLAGLALRTPGGWVLAAWAWAGLLVLAVLDATVLRLPDPLTLAAVFGSGLALSAGAVATRHYGPLVQAVLCALALAAAYLVADLVFFTGLFPAHFFGEFWPQVPGWAAATRTSHRSSACAWGWIGVGAALTATVAAVLLAGAHIAALLATAASAAPTQSRSAVHAAQRAHPHHLNQPRTTTRPTLG